MLFIARGGSTRKLFVVFVFVSSVRPCYIPDKLIVRCRRPSSDPGRRSRGTREWRLLFDYPRLNREIVRHRDKNTSSLSTRADVSGIPFLDSFKPTHDVVFWIRIAFWFYVNVSSTRIHFTKAWSVTSPRSKLFLRPH